MTASQHIDAPPRLVFNVASSPTEYGRAVPAIVRTEFLSGKREGVGTRFRSVRAWKGREAATDLDITEMDPPKRMRTVAEGGGSTW